MKRQERNPEGELQKEMMREDMEDDTMNVYEDGVSDGSEMNEYGASAADDELLLDESVQEAMLEFEELYGDGLLDGDSAVMVVGEVPPTSPAAGTVAVPKPPVANAEEKPASSVTAAMQQTFEESEAASGDGYPVQEAFEESEAASDDGYPVQEEAPKRATPLVDDYLVEETPVYYTAPVTRQEKKKSPFGKIAIVVVALCLVAVCGFGIYRVVDGIRETKREEEREAARLAELATTEATTTEEITTEEVRWFEEKEACVPVMEANTVSIPKADLSIFQAAEEQPDEDNDPWTQVTVNLESVDGSINYTSPGEASTTTQLTSTYMVLVDADTGKIIAERDCEKQVVPASMTKILTVLTARDYVNEENLDDTFIITEDIIREAQASGLSAVGFLPGQEVTVRDMLYGTIVCSGADAAMGLARYCLGTEEEFVKRMNENVEMLGLSDTAHFTNVVGKYDEDLYCTMTDMATILSVAIQDDLLRDVLSKRIYTTDTKYELKDEDEDEDESETTEEDSADGEDSTEEKNMVPFELSNWFLRRIEDKEMLGNVVGAKTGFVNQSGFCAASYYEANNGKRYICVTGNAYSSWRAIYDHVAVYRSLTN